MPRARNIKPSFFDNDLLAECAMSARMLFIGLWCVADRDGRLEDRPRKIKAEIFPYDDIETDELLQSLHDRGFIIRYEANGVKCIQVKNFAKHQKPHRNEKSAGLPPYISVESGKGPKRSRNVATKSESLGPKSDAIGKRSVSLRRNDECGMMNEEGGMRNDERGIAQASDDASCASQEPPELLAWLSWWNILADSGAVLYHVTEGQPSQAVKKAWMRVQLNTTLAAPLADRDKLAEAIKASDFCRKGWFRLEKLLGGTNQDGESIAQKLLDGGYKGTERPLLQQAALAGTNYDPEAAKKDANYGTF
jgi:hypothetical protein